LDVEVYLGKASLVQRVDLKLTLTVLETLPEVAFVYYDLKSLILLGDFKIFYTRSMPKIFAELSKIA
jgi:hypothetical protein